MYKWLSTTKQGFTLIELMIVIVLMSLGAIALINLTTIFYKTYSKTEERYVKQEEVKRVVDLLQNGTNINKAIGVEIYNNLNIMPPEGDGMGVKGYSFLYTDPSDGLLYVRESGSDYARAISDIPLYIFFEVLKKREGVGGYIFNDNETGGTLTNQRGMRCSVNALENTVTDFSYPIDDEDIYYTLNVSYSFANMTERENGRVNLSANNEVLKSSLFNQTTGEETTTTVDSVDVGNIVKFYSDQSIMGDAVTTDISMSSWCFVATASFGQESPDVGLLCHFRDSVLRKTELGNWFIDKYYTYSPPIADKIADSPTLRFATRTLLKPLVLTAYVIMNPEWFILVVPMAGALVITIVRRKQKIELVD